MINNIPFIINYFSKNLIQNIINKCEANDQYCLTSILYYINKYMRKSDNLNLISGNELSQKYSNFIEYLSKTNFQNSNFNSCYYNINNSISILNFIYEKINNELTKVNLESKYNNNYLLNYENDPLLKYKMDFSLNNRSIISDHFMGTFQKKIQCQNCNNNNIVIYQNNDTYSYFKFSYIIFDLNEIYNFYSINNILNNFQINNNFNQKINLNDCFKYCFIHKRHKYYTSYCNKCFINTYQDERFSLFKGELLLVFSKFTAVNSLLILSYIKFKILILLLIL